MSMLYLPVRRGRWRCWWWPAARGTAPEASSAPKPGASPCLRAHLLAPERTRSKDRQARRVRFSSGASGPSLASHTTTKTTTAARASSTMMLRVGKEEGRQKFRLTASPLFIHRRRGNKKYIYVCTSNRERLSPSPSLSPPVRVYRNRCPIGGREWDRRCSRWRCR